MASITITNTNKNINAGKTWDAATESWDAATYTWDSTGTTITNTAKNSPISLTNPNKK